MEDCAILDLDYSTFSQIRNILENPNTMRSFLEILPADCSSEDVLNSMDIEGRKYNMTPAKYLLQFLGSKEYRVSHLIQWFEAISLEKALVHLKKPEGLRIIEHPCEVVRINEGDELLLTCQASSYPHPEYQWYKGDEDLLLQIKAVLSIKNARLKDAGTYTCLVTRRDPVTNSFEYCYSNCSCVEVIPLDLHTTRSFSQDPQPLTPNFVLPRKHILQEENFDHEEVTKSFQTEFVAEPKFILNDQRYASLTADTITITKHPYVDGKVSQGMCLCLTCEATCTRLVYYQWLKNGRPLNDEKSSTLILKNLYPDPHTGEMKWTYQCAVYNEYEQILSRTAVIELKEVNDTTPFTAQVKLAFMVANDTYDHLEDLLKPAADVTDVAQMLSSMGFKIFAFRNLTLTEIRNAFAYFCNMLKPGSYALFFFSGHGFDLYGQTYLQPVDCSENTLQQESICSEYVLQCMQETKPAVNILIIDACRKLPSSMSESSKPQDVILPGKIFQAKMKNNTIYGYSTSFLYASHESDEELNSVFVKHLKKYLNHNKSIPEVLMMVQKDFAKDPLTKNLQFPVIKSTLAQPRKLSDPLQNTSASSESSILHWCDIKRDIISKDFVPSNLKTIIKVEFHHHNEVFCNGIDVFVYLNVEPSANMTILHDMEINLAFKSHILKVLPVNGIALKNASLQIGTNFLFKKEVLDIQKVNDGYLIGEISLHFCSINMFRNTEFTADITKIAELQLSINHLQSSNIEEHNYSVIQNYFK